MGNSLKLFQNYFIYELLLSKKLEFIKSESFFFDDQKQLQFVSAPEYPE